MPYKRYGRKRSYNRRRSGRRSYKRSYRRKSSMFRVATAATKKVLAKRTERKQVVVSATGTSGQNLTNNNVVCCCPLENIPKGDEAYTRQGSSIYVKWMVLKGWFVARSSFAAPGMMRTLMVRIMLVRHMGNFPNNGSSTNVFGNATITDFNNMCFQEQISGVVPLESLHNVVDHRQKKFIVLYDKMHVLKPDSVSTTVDYRPQCKTFRAAVRINRKIKYDDIGNITPVTIEGYQYSWFVISWSPLQTTGDNVGLFNCAHYTHYTDS